MARKSSNILNWKNLATRPTFWWHGTTTLFYQSDSSYNIALQGGWHQFYLLPIFHNHQHESFTKFMRRQIFKRSQSVRDLQRILVPLFKGSNQLHQWNWFFFKLAMLFSKTAYMSKCLTERYYMWRSKIGGKIRDSQL